MKKILYNMIRKWPIKILFVTLIVVATMIIFVGDISLSTGNETLIGTDTDTYQDNYDYQKTFGTDPIMVIFEGNDQEELLSYASLSSINELVVKIRDLDGVFYVNSPIGIIDYATNNSYINYETALDELGTGLLSISTMIETMSITDETFDVETLITTFDTLSSAQETLRVNFEDQVDVFTLMQVNVSDEILRLEAIKSTLDPVVDQSRVQSITQTVQILTNVNDLYDQLILGNTNLANAATQTAFALDQIATQLSTMFTTIAGMESNLDSLSTNLNVMGNSLVLLASNFNMFKPSFPTSSTTLEMMVYPEGERNPMLDVFMIDDSHMFMSIILDESATNNDIEKILSEIDAVLTDGFHEDALISGKPVLDYDIQSSMMDSMRVMMVSAGIIMVVIMLLLFPVKARLLPIFIVLLAVVTTVGIMGLFSIPLTMVSMAVFPILIGLGIDYSIQFQNRYMEEKEGVVHE